MTLSDDLINGVRRTLQTQLVIRDGRKVPEKSDLRFLNGGGGVQLDATYVYADLADSSGLAQRMRKDVAANIIRCYVHTAAKAFRSYGGEIRSFDGDRVMAIFVGDQKNYAAVRAALALNWVVGEVINPIINDTWSDISTSWQMKHAVGVATGQCLIVRGGVFGDSDMISIGAAPNVAAKLSDLRPSDFGPPYSIYITEDVYVDLPESVKLNISIASNQFQYLSYPNTQASPTDIWDPLGLITIGGSQVWIRGSTYQWEP
jgi:adenylate cyclase